MSVIFRVHSAHKTDVGQRRSHNEDFVGKFEPTDQRSLKINGYLYVLADGVGGAAHGERASRYAVQKVLYEYYRRGDVPPKERLTQIIQEVSSDIYNYSHSEAVGRAMATTLVAAVIWGESLIVANVGDSRAYLWRDGKMTQLTQDHSVVEEMVRQGLMSAEEARTSKIRNRLSRSVGGQPRPEVDIFTYTLQPGDKILLCSDGLTRYAESEDLAAMMGDGSPEDITQRLIDFANRAGGSDNISAIVVEVGEPIATEEWMTEQAPTVLAPPEALDGSVPPPTTPTPMTTPTAEPAKPPLNRKQRWGVGLAIVLIGVMSCVLGFVGIVVASKMRRQPTPPPMVNIPTATRGAAALPFTATPPPTVALPTATPIILTATPAPTMPLSTPTWTPLPEGRYLCLGIIGQGGAFYALLAQFDLVPTASRQTMWSLASQGRFREVLYADKGILPPEGKVVPLGRFSSIPVPKESPTANETAWDKFEDKLIHTLTPTSMVILPGVDRETCVTNGGEWRAFNALPPWLRGPFLPTPTNTAAP